MVHTKTNSGFGLLVGSKQLNLNVLLLSTFVLISVPLLAQNIGVGTTNPQARLHIMAPSGYTFPLLQIENDGSTAPYLIVQPDGKVGIGIANPAEVLDVSGNIQFSGALMPAGNPGTAGFVLTSEGPGTAPTWTDPATFGDNWGSQVAQTQGPIVGDGTSANPIGLQSGTNAGDILIWDGLQWQIKPSPFDSVCGTAMANYVQKWTGSELCNSIIYDNGTRIGIGTATPVAPYQVTMTGQLLIGTNVPTASAGNVNAYIGADAVNNDMEIGSTNPNIEWIALWNRGGAGFMSLTLDSVKALGYVRIGSNAPPLHRLDVTGAIRGDSLISSTILLNPDLGGNKPIYFSGFYCHWVTGAFDTCRGSAPNDHAWGGRVNFDTKNAVIAGPNNSSLYIPFRTPYPVNPFCHVNLENLVAFVRINPRNNDVELLLTDFNGNPIDWNTVTTWMIVTCFGMY